jgi:hypothetical protein
MMNATVAESLHGSWFADSTDKPKSEFEELRSKLLSALDVDDDKAWVKAHLSNHFTFKARLRCLAAMPDSDAVAIVVPDVEAWVRSLGNARNGIAHDGTGRQSQLFHLEWATTGLLTLAFMARLGLSPEIQKRTASQNLRALSSA